MLDFTHILPPFGANKYTDDSVVPFATFIRGKLLWNASYAVRSVLLMRLAFMGVYENIRRSLRGEVDDRF